MPITNEDVWAEIQNIKRDLGAVSEQVTLDSATLANIQSILTASQASQSGVNALTPVTISPISNQSIGLQLAAVGDTPVSGAFTANLRCYVPFYVTNSITVLDAWVLNGTGVIAGNVDVTIYTSALAKVVGTGSIAQATPGGILLQKLAIADTVLAAGNYYMSIAFSDATATAFRWGTEIGRAHV